MAQSQNELSYYPEIMEFIRDQIESNFKASKTPLKVYCKTGELHKGLQEIISENGITEPAIVQLAQNAPTLSLDIFALITNGVRYQLLVLEIKLLKQVGLMQLSQLIGYCIVANAKYGILINVNGDESTRLTKLLSCEPDLTKIHRTIHNGQDEIVHHLAVMEWDSYSKSLNYTGKGAFRFMSELCGLLAADFQ